MASAEKTLDPADAAMEIEVARRLLGHVEDLGESYRRIVALRYYEGLKPKEIAARVGEPVGTVKTRLARALEMLRHRLDADDPKGRGAWFSAMVAIGRTESTVARATGGALGGAGLWASAAALIFLTGLALGTYVLLSARDRVDAEVSGVTLASHSDVPLKAGELLTAGTRSASRRIPLATAEEDALAEMQTLTSRVVDAPFGSFKGEGIPAPGVPVQIIVRKAPATRSSTDPRHVDQLPLAQLADALGNRIDVVTALDGSFTLTIPKGAEVISILAMGSENFRPATWTGPNSEWPTELTRTMKSSVVGRVVDLDGNPVGNVLVKARVSPGQEPAYVETLSNEHGQFAIDHTSDSLGVVGVRDGWIHVGARWTDADQREARRSAELVMTPAGTLDLNIVDPSGEAVTDFPVNVHIRPGEPCTALRGYQPRDRFFLELDTDELADGHASLSVPSGVALTCANSLLTVSDQHDGLAVCTGRLDDSAQPIVVPPGGHYRLTVALAVHRLVRGRTIDTEGRPVANCTLNVKAIEERQGRMPYRSRFRSNERGEFSFPIASTEEFVTLQVEAAGREAEAPYSALIATTQQKFARVDEGPLIIQLAKKSPPSETLSIVDPGWSVKPSARVEFISDDGFENVTALDVYVGRFASTPSNPKIASDMGDSTLEPAYVQGAWFDAAHPDHPQGRLRIEKRQIKVDDGKARVWLNPGIAWLGVQPRDAGKRAMQQMCTGLVRFEPGSVTLNVQPRSVTPVSARIILEEAPRQKLYAALVDSSGHHLYGSPIAAWQEIRVRRFPVGTRGDFGVIGVPLGSWHVWIGSRAELDSGLPRFDEWIEVSEGRALDLKLGHD